MPCYHPFQAYQSSDGSVAFVERKGCDVVRTLTLACGQCVGCRLERSRQWAVRCMHEAQMHEENCFVTLTYREPGPVSLDYRDFQLFMKRLRERFPERRIRFYVAGEYGCLCRICRRVEEKCICPAFIPDLGRPHYHALLFGMDFPDRKYHALSPAGFKLYRSAVLESLWTVGFSSVGAVTFESAAYAARYIMKKVNGDLAEQHYLILDSETGEFVSRSPEFNRMSLKPGIGSGWYAKFRGDIENGKVVVNGVEANLPRYYKKKLANDIPVEYEDIEFGIHKSAVARASDNTDDRLAVKEAVTNARVALLKRKVG